LRIQRMAGDCVLLHTPHGEQKAQTSPKVNNCKANHSADIADESIRIHTNSVACD
jgi:hypothetical protein